MESTAFFRSEIQILDDFMRRISNVLVQSGRMSAVKRFQICVWARRRVQGFGFPGSSPCLTASFSLDGSMLTMQKFHHEMVYTLVTMV